MGLELGAGSRGRNGQKGRDKIGVKMPRLAAVSAYVSHQSNSRAPRTSPFSCISICPMDKKHLFGRNNRRTGVSDPKFSNIKRIQKTITTPTDKSSDIQRLACSPNCKFHHTNNDTANDKSC